MESRSGLSVTAPTGNRVILSGVALGWELWPVLGGTEQRLGIGVIVADARPGVRGLDAQPVEHRQYRGGLERGAVVAVQHGLGAHRGIPSASAVRRTRCAARSPRGYQSFWR